MVRVIIAVLMVVVLAGCANKYLAPPYSMSNEDALEEYYRCLAIAGQMTAAYDPGNVFITNDQMEDCLVAHGWDKLKTKPTDRPSVTIKT